MGRVIKVLLLGVLAIAALVATSCSSDDSDDYPGGGKAPDFALKGLDGQMASLGRLSGHPVLLNFWATWCGPCRSELPFLQELFEDKSWSDKGLVILGVSSGEPAERVEQFMKDNNLSFPVLLDTSQSVTQEYRVQYIPTTFFIDKDGIIKSIKIGAFASKQEIENGLKQIVQ